MAKTSNVYDVTMPLTSKALYPKDVFEFVIHNGTKNISYTGSVNMHTLYTCSFWKEKRNTFF